MSDETYLVRNTSREEIRRRERGRKTWGEFWFGVIIPCFLALSFQI
jgi:hypothetical protein